MESPVIICTIVVVVDIAARRQHFQAASLLPRKMSANGGTGGRPMRRSALPSLPPPDRNNVPLPSSFSVAPPMATAVIGGRHFSLVIVPLLQTVAVIVLVLLISPKECRSPIVTLVQGGQHMTTTAALRQSTHMGCCCCGPSAKDDPHQSTPSLHQPLGSIGGVIRATYDARSNRGSSPKNVIFSNGPKIHVGCLIYSTRCEFDILKVL